MLDTSIIKFLPFCCVLIGRDLFPLIDIKYKFSTTSTFFKTTFNLFEITGFGYIFSTEETFS